MWKNTNHRQKQWEAVEVATSTSIVKTQSKKVTNMYIELLQIKHVTIHGPEEREEYVCNQIKT